MKIHQTFHLVTLLSALTLSASADTFKLQDGRSIEGEISLETADSYILSIEVKKGIRDEISIKKSDVLSIKESKVSAPAKVKSGPPVKRLQKLLPTADLLEEKDYQRLLDRYINPQLKKHADSPEIGAVKEIESTLLAEKERVAKGDIKLGGKWLTAEEVEANKYEVVAAIAAHKIKNHLNAKEYSEAFTELSVLQKGFSDTKPFREVVQLCLKELPIYKAQAQRIVSQADAEVTKRDLSLERLPSAAAIRLKNSLAKEEDEYQEALSKAKAARSSWLPLNRYHPESAETVLRTIDKEILKLKKFDTTYIDSGEIYRNALAELDKNDLKAANSLISQFSKSRPDRVYVSILRDKKKQLSDELRLIKQQKREEAAEQRRLEREAKEKARNMPAEKSEAETPAAKAPAAK